MRGYWALADLIEAAAWDGTHAEARLHLAQLEAVASQTSVPYLLATLTYARPLLAADEEAEQLYQAALSRDMSNWPCYRGRLLLNYGSWLRRQRASPNRAPCSGRHWRASTPWP